jgi:hypothetical protein
MFKKSVLKSRTQVFLAVSAFTIIVAISKRTFRKKREMNRITSKQIVYNINGVHTGTHKKAFDNFGT